MTVQTFVAVGDSFTEGVADGPGPGDQYVGWADRLAHRLQERDAALRYANLAIRGKLLDEVVRDQLPTALGMAPDLLSFHAGGNDVLRPGVDVDLLGGRYAAAVARAAAGCGRLLLFTVIERAGDAGDRASAGLAARIGRFNQHVRDAADRYGAVLVDAAAAEVLADRRLWHEDRLHLGPDGHDRVARAVLAGLVAAGDVAGPAPEAEGWDTPLPPRPEVSTGQRLVDDARWVAGHLLPWVGRRLRGVSSGDGRVAKRPALRRP